MTPYAQKLQDCLIDIGKAVEKMQDEKKPNIIMIGNYYNKFLKAVAKEDMKEMNRTSKALIAALAKWRIEKL